MSEQELTGRVVLVTGGGSGIGRASAMAFARAGASVVVSDVASEAGEATAQAIRDAGSTAIFQQADVSAAGQVAALVARTVEEFGRLAHGAPHFTAAADAADLLGYAILTQ